jgi:hypothetical protein
VIKARWLKRIGAGIRHGQRYLRKSCFDNTLSGPREHLFRNVYASYVTEFAHNACEFKRRSSAATANIQHVFSGNEICLPDRRVASRSEKRVQPVLNLDPLASL